MTSAEQAGAVNTFAQEPNGGLIVGASRTGLAHRGLIITLAARHKLPAVYWERFFVTGGGLISYGPDSVDPFRRAAGLALLGGQICKSPEQYKAWSQNLGHDNVLTTFSSYGDVARHRQAEIIRGLGRLSIGSRVGDPDRQAGARS